jgi:transmembrane sensor
MDNVAPFPHVEAGQAQDAIRAQASAWIARLDRGDLSPAEDREFREWINRSPRHRSEIRRLSALWEDLNILTELDTGTAPVPGRRAGVWHWPAGVAAASVAILAVALGLAYFIVPAPSDAPDFYAADIGAQKTVTLDDGSLMQLNTDSHARVEFTDTSRRIHLLRGEAFFDVTPDPARPFAVHAGNNTVRAVGTAFSVHLSQQELEVLVTEGTVELTAEPAPTTPGANTGNATATQPPPRPAIAVSAGHRATRRGNEESVQAVSRQDLQRKLAWRQKMLVFLDTPLADVVSEFNRYTTTTIVVSDPELSRLRIGGYFKAGETEALLGALESGFGVKVIRANDKLVYLTLAE